MGFLEFKEFKEARLVGKVSAGVSEVYTVVFHLGRFHLEIHRSGHEAKQPVSC